MSFAEATDMRKHLPLWLIFAAAVLVTGYSQSRQDNGVSTKCESGLCYVSAPLSTDSTNQTGEKKMDYTVTTTKSVDRASADIERLTAEKQFRVLAVHDVSATLAAKGYEQPPMKIIEICSAKHAYKAIKADPKISLMLPCPISVYQHEGKTHISTMLPTKISTLFPGAQLGTMPQEVEQVLRDILDEVK